MSKIASAAFQIPAQGRSFSEVTGHVTDVVSELEKQTGFLFYRLLRPVAPEDPYTMLTFWQSRRHYRNAAREVSQFQR
ncbi:MAG: hypothetical protein F6K62_22350 [Sphaerospermopsis sp. SIO1G2]|nr:hypothetical protein [Sphaerospermopsis sp. SIO1G2]